MKNSEIFFTAGDFAKLHNVNRRTLHYYDDIGLFTPSYKGENGYRYYTFQQSIEFEQILALRELGMSIQELKEYLHTPSYDAFINISQIKIDDIDKTIKRLSGLKKTLKMKNDMLSLSQNVYDGMIDIVELPESYLFMTNTNINFQDYDDVSQSIDSIMKHLKPAWDMISFKLGCGSFISLDKVKNADFNLYDGLYTEIDGYKRNLVKKAKGKYLRGFIIGSWDKIPHQYEKMLAYATENNLSLTGFAYERGLNEFAVSDASEYVTEITIKCD